jgi:pimeloyl-ACP methyl ester carboxylesterase
MTNPTLVIVPGSFGPAKMYDGFVETLKHHDIKTVVISTPSVGRKEGRPPATMSDDAQEISNVVSKLLDEGKNVVLMTHSYGGIPGTESLKTISREAREKEGKDGGVDKIVYLTSMVLQPGTSNFEAFGGALPDFLTMEDDYMTLDAEVNASLTFSDVPAEQALELAKQMDVHSTPSFKEKLTYPGYNDVEVHYIVCEQDLVIPPVFQRGMIEGIKASTGRDVTVHTLESGHVPISSQPENTSKIIEKVIKA